MKEMLKEQRDRLVKKKCTGVSNKLKRNEEDGIRKDNTASVPTAEIDICAIQRTP